MLPSLLAQSPLQVQPDPAHPIAAALVGDWRADAELQKRLGAGKAPNAVSFREDATVLANLPTAAVPALAGQRLYAAGRMRLADRDDIYVLIQAAGVAQLRTFRNRADAGGDGETLVVMLVRGATPAQDLLFLNGDLGNQAFTAFTRHASAPAKLEPTAALTEMARLLETKQYEAFLQTWCLPTDLAQMQQGGRSLAATASEFGERKAAEALAMLLAAAKLTPTRNDAGDEAIYQGEGLRRRMRLKLLGGRWYLCNR